MDLTIIVCLRSWHVSIIGLCAITSGRCWLRTKSLRSRRKQKKKEPRSSLLELKHPNSLKLLLRWQGSQASRVPFPNWKRKTSPVSHFRYQCIDVHSYKSIYPRMLLIHSYSCLPPVSQPSLASTLLTPSPTSGQPLEPELDLLSQNSGSSPVTRKTKACQRDNATSSKEQEGLEEEKENKVKEEKGMKWLDIPGNHSFFDPNTHSSPLSSKKWWSTYNFLRT